VLNFCRLTKQNNKAKQQSKTTKQISKSISTAKVEHKHIDQIVYLEL